MAYLFLALNQSTPLGCTIEFVDLPTTVTRGAVYDETVYYSYRVLAQYLMTLDDPASAATAKDLPLIAPEDAFYSLVSVEPDLNPHHMQTHLITPFSTSRMTAKAMTQLEHTLLPSGVAQ